MTVLLPKEPAYDFADALNPAFRNEDKRLPHLLLVDDEPRLLTSLNEFLGGRGFQLSTASSGKKR